MAVIKSAIELAMERTRNLVLGEEEKRTLAEKEIEVKTRAVVRRYLQGMTEIDGVTKELDGVNAQTRTSRDRCLSIYSSMSLILKRRTDDCLSYSTLSVVTSRSL
jgi:hypothetical protein